MKCINCDNSKPEYSFTVLEVHTLHIRDFGGERLVQALGEERTFSVCAACVSEEMRAVLFPAGRILRGSLGFGVVFLAGIALTLVLTLRDVMPALRVIGPLAVFVGVSGIASVVRRALAEREDMSRKSEDEARRTSAWRCVLKSAPKKYNDNDITYIPVEDVLGLTPEELSAKYELLPAIARKAKEQEL